VRDVQAGIPASALLSHGAVGAREGMGNTQLLVPQAVSGAHDAALQGRRGLLRTSQHRQIPSDAERCAVRRTAHGERTSTTLRKAVVHVCGPTWCIDVVLGSRKWVVGSRSGSQAWHTVAEAESNYNFPFRAARVVCAVRCTNKASQRVQGLACSDVLANHCYPSCLCSAA
jgi:hypothetical protein